VRLTLRTRLTLVYTAVFGLLLTAIGLVSYRVLARQLDADATAELEELTRGLHGYLLFDGEAPRLEYDRADPEQAAFIHEATRYYQIYEIGSGRLLVQSDALAPLGVHFTPAEVRAFEERPAPLDLATDFGRIRLSNSLVSPAAGRSFLLQVGASLDGMDHSLEQFFDLLLWTVPAGLGAAALAGRWTAGLALAPLSRLAIATRGIDIAELERRLPVRGTGDELDDVAIAFNDTLERLERAVGEMRQWSLALAHELRTPLTALRGEIEMAMRAPAGAEDGAALEASERRLASLLEEIDKLKRVIDQVLTLARAEAGEIAIARERVDLGALGASLCDQLDLVAQARGIGLHYQVDGEAHVVGDASWLERLLLNLVDNAIKFTPEGGRVDVRVGRGDDAALLEVKDTGIGMSSEVAPRIFEHFYRADPARSPGSEGAGLGLSLVKWIADRHDGRISVESRPGAGSIFRVRLPLAPGPALSRSGAHH
jgi:heavy metal sensor kinase